MPIKKYNILDLLDVLGPDELKTSRVKTKLIQEKEGYENIHIDWIKKLLFKLHENGLVCGHQDNNFGGYVWSIPDELRYDPEDVIKVLCDANKKPMRIHTKRYISTSYILKQLTKSKKNNLKYGRLSEKMAVIILKNIQKNSNSFYSIDNNRDEDTKKWYWSIREH
jgi:hypothetical protein